MRNPLLAAAIALCATLGALAADVAVHEPTAQAKGSGGWLGVAMEPGKGKPGVVVTHVIRTSPAEKGGLLAGDRIVKVDGAPIATPTDVTAQVALLGPGKSIGVDVMRAGKPQSLTVVLAARPSADQIFRMEMLGQDLGKRMPALTLVSGGGPLAYPALDGHVVVIDLFATWCGPCAQLRPHMQALHAKYGPQGLRVIAISDEDPTLLATWSAKTGVGFTVAADPSDDAFIGWSAPALPSSLVVDKHGVVREVEVGFEPSQVGRVEQLVQALLKEP